MRITLVLLSAIFSSSVLFAQSDTCDCKKYSEFYESLGRIINKTGVRVQVCGVKEEGFLGVAICMQIL
jgi:hypothetical protein